MAIPYPNFARAVDVGVAVELTFTLKK